jgi:uncharacterized protein (DUF58 family)
MTDLRSHLAAGERAGRRYSLGLPRLAPVGAFGGVLNQRAGSSQEFHEYREYQPGDDLRHIDWHAYARTDHLTVRLFREEINPHVDVVLDASRSMALEGSAKAEAAAGLAAFFATAASNAGYSYRAWLASDAVRPLENGNAVPLEWAEWSFDYRGVPGEAMPTSGPNWRPRGLRVLLSDLLWPGDPLAALRPLAERASMVVVAQVLAEADVNPPEGETMRLIDAETDEARELYLDAAVLRRYRDALDRHRENWHAACRQAGAVFTTVVAERWLRDGRLDELVAADVLKVV